MHETPSWLRFLVLSLGWCMVSHGAFALSQTTAEASSRDAWRRTAIGWEVADSLPLHPAKQTDSREQHFAPLPFSRDAVYGTHRLILPIALAGFMACAGPWMLLRWPPSAPREHA